MKRKKKMLLALGSTAFLQTQNSQYLPNMSSSWRVKITDFEWSITLGLMKSAVRRGMVITL